MMCPYKRECATTMYWPRIKAGFIRGICNTHRHEACSHFMSLKSQHDERQKLYGDPHAHEPDWGKIDV